MTPFVVKARGMLNPVEINATKDVVGNIGNGNDHPMVKVRWNTLSHKIKARLATTRLKDDDL